MKHRVISYHPKLKERAVYLRRHMTLAEVLLWKTLKGRQIQGYQFSRQRPIDEYIVDFYCKELRLAIEVDGATHNFKWECDAVRQRRLESLGVRFLRFWDIEVKDEIGSVVERIVNWIKRETGELTEPPPVIGQPTPATPPLPGGD